VALTVSGMATIGVGFGLAGALAPRAWAVVAGVLAAFATVAVAAPRIASSLPEALDEASRRQPRRRWWWIALAVVALLQMGRLGVGVVDDGARIAWPLVYRDSAHMCLPAYLRAAELAREGDANIYDATLYRRGVDTSVEGMAPHIRDPFQYPPTALILPRLALAVTPRFAPIRAGWFGLQLALFVWASWWLAGCVDARRGGWSARLLWPLLFVALPTLHNFSYGQAHLITMAAAVVGVVAIERKREVAGGALLGTAIAIKLFPALLLLPLVVRRRHRAVLITSATVALLGAAAWVIVGADAVTAFLSYQVPRLASGAAFEKFLSNAGFTHPHLSVSGVMFTLRGLGVNVGWTAARAVSILYGLGLLAMAAHFGRARREGTSLAWLGLTNLAASLSPYSPSEYVMAPTLWTITLLSAPSSTRRLVAVAAAWLFMQTAPFVGKLPVLWKMPRLGSLVTIAALVIAVVVNAWVVASAQGEPEVSSS